jgi:ubiquinone/menaquinone biosynthesis C-methylase UbiE
MPVAEELRFRLNSLLKEGLSESAEEHGIPQYYPRAIEHLSQAQLDREAGFIDNSTRVAYSSKSSLFAPATTEGLYRTVDSLLLASVRMDAEANILDVGCGTGRTIYDCAPLLSRALFVGLDRSLAMCKRAKEILVEGHPIPLPSLARQGFSNLVFREAKSLANVVIVQGSAGDLPFRSGSFDAITSTMLIDRVVDPRSAIAEMVRVTKPGGTVIMATPLNLAQPEKWDFLGDVNRLAEAVSDAGTDVREKFDGLVYREIIDARGNYSEWCVCVIVAGKRGAALGTKGG